MQHVAHHNNARTVFNFLEFHVGTSLVFAGALVSQQDYLPYLEFVLVGKILAHVILGGSLDQLGNKDGTVVFGIR